MFFIAARKDTKVELEKGSRNLDFSNSAIITAFRSALCTNYDITDDNLSFLYVDDANVAVTRVMSGDDYTLVWNASDELINVSFAVEDTKRWVKVICSDTEVLANGIDSTTIDVELWRADKTAIATSVNATADVPILTPLGPRKVRVTLVNGKASKVFKTTIAGEWVIPAKTRFGQVRVWESVTIDAIQSFEDLQ